MRLKVKEKSEYRNKLLKEQRGVCPLCGTKINKGEETLDHDHKTGRIRRVLHRSCNQAEGRILSWIIRSRAEDPIKFLQALVEHWTADYSDMPIYPSHKTEIEQEILRLTRIMKKRRKERTRQKYRDMINKLKEQANGSI